VQGLADPHLAVKLSRPPAHIRRSSGIGGRKPPRQGWPSVSSPDIGVSGRKAIQCQSAGSGPPSASPMADRVPAS
jgi:hypothetical protein